MASLFMVPWQNQLLKKLQSHWHPKAAPSNSIRSEKTSTFSFRSNANVPIHEIPGVMHSHQLLHLTLIMLMSLT